MNLAENSPIYTNVNIANVAIGLSTPEAPKNLWSFYAETWIRDQEVRGEEGKYFQKLKELSVSGVEEARLLAQRATVMFPYSRRIKRIAELLEPPRVRANPSAHLSREKEFAWIRENKHKHKGMWVALNGDKCLALGKDFVQVQEKAKSIGSNGTFLMFYLPGQND